MAAAALKKLEPENAPEPAPRKLWRVWQNKYQLEGQPRWKRLYFWLIYMPVAWFTYFVVKIPILNRVDEATGRLGWEEDQGLYSTKERAESVIAGRPFWHGKSLIEDVDIAADTCQACDYICPGSVVAPLYESRTLAAVSVPREKAIAWDRAAGASGAMNRPITAEEIRRAREQHEKLRDTLNSL